MSQEAKQLLKQALISVIIGSVVTFISALLEGLLGIFKQTIFSYSGVPISMLYFLRKRAIV